MRLRKGDFGPKFPPFQAALLRVTVWMNSCEIFMKRLKRPFPLRSPPPNRAAPNGCWNCLHEIRFRSRLRPDDRATRLDIGSCQRLPPYLRQERQCRPAVGSYPRQQAIEDRSVAAFG